MLPTHQDMSEFAPSENALVTIDCECAEERSAPLQKVDLAAMSAEGIAGPLPLAPDDDDESDSDTDEGETEVETVQLGFAEKPPPDEESIFLNSDWSQWDGGKIGGAPVRSNHICAPLYRIYFLWCRFGWTNVIFPQPIKCSASTVKSQWDFFCRCSTIVAMSLSDEDCGYVRSTVLWTRLKMHFTGFFTYSAALEQSVLKRTGHLMLIITVVCKECHTHVLCQCDMPSESAPQR